MLCSQVHSGAPTTVYDQLDTTGALSQGCAPSHHSRRAPQVHSNWCPCSTQPAHWHNLLPQPLGVELVENQAGKSVSTMCGIGDGTATFECHEVKELV